MGKEFELKYRADIGKIAAIREKFGGFTAISMETAYFDTPDRALSRRRCTLRRRLENGVPVCALKTPGENGVRGEWEIRCDTISQAIQELCKQNLPIDLSALTQNGVSQTCAARFTRLAALIRTPDCAVELALDQGCLLGGGRELPLSEVEVELKEGSQEAAAAFADALAKEFGLTPEPKSKLARALELAQSP